jgi:uncharacterized membrane protein YkoI
MTRRTKHLAAAVAVVAVAAGVGAAAVAAGSGDDDEAPITGAALERATRAALAHTGQGRVTETEVGDEDSYYEVEVTLDDGSQVDVQLDENFEVVDATPDSDETDDADD